MAVVERGEAVSGSERWKGKVSPPSRSTASPLVSDKATVPVPSGAHGGGWEGLGEDGTETALYISKIG